MSLTINKKSTRALTRAKKLTHIFLPPTRSVRDDLVPAGRQRREGLGHLRDIPGLPRRRAGQRPVRHRVRGEAPEAGVRRGGEGGGEAAVPAQGGVAAEARGADTGGEFCCCL